MSAKIKKSKKKDEVKEPERVQTPQINQPIAEEETELGFRDF